MNTTPTRARRTLEHSEQVMLVKWAQLRAAAVPELRLLLAIPNGGQRHYAVAAKLKAEGVRAGVPDLLLPVARGAYHGLWVEMKAESGTTTTAQDWWLEQLRGQGYRAEVCRGFEAARKVIEEYLAA